MSGRIEEAISKYVQNRSDTQLRELDRALLEGNFYVPIGAVVRELRPGRFDVPAICIRTEAGLGALPVFTSLDHLREWTPQGCQYTELSGERLIRMAQDMPEVSEIVVNVAGVPRGRIPRSDFGRMLALN
jgi:hypothetical protein